MESLIGFWNSYPKIQQVVWVAVAALVVVVMVRVANRFFPARVRDPVARYRMRKFISFMGYAPVIIYGAVIFSSRLEEFAVALGLVGAASRWPCRRPSSAWRDGPRFPPDLFSGRAIG